MVIALIWVKFARLVATTVLPCDASIIHTIIANFARSQSQTYLFTKFYLFFKV